MRRLVPPEPIIDGNLAAIQLTRGKFALVNTVDLPLVGDTIWQAQVCNGRFYAAYHSLLMHRVLLGEVPFPGAEIDHINGDSLDNRRTNLRWATRSEQLGNKRKRSDSTNQFKGVRRNRKGWQALIQGRALGTFPTQEEAAAAYDRAAIQTYGEFARLNFPKESNG